MQRVLPQYAHHPIEEIRAYDLHVAYRLEGRQKTGHSVAVRVREASIRGPAHQRIARILADMRLLTTPRGSGQAYLHRRHALTGECEDLFHLLLIGSGSLNLLYE